MTETEKLLLESNETLRSAFQIAERDGVSTNWSAWRDTLKGVLSRQHDATNRLRDIRMADLEGDAEIGAGAVARDPE